MLVSLIMPLFNGEFFLKDAIDSVLNQSYINFELIIIDDKSSDNSINIVSEYLEYDNRIKLYKNRKNLGICATRNKGISFSKGDYITFLDNDDIIDKDFIKENIELLLKYKAEGIRFGRKLIDVNKSNEIIRESDTIFFNEYVENYSLENKYNKYYLFKKNNILLNVWNGIYSRKVIIENGILFDETMKFGSEDAKFSYEFFDACESIVLNPKVYYTHYRRDMSSTSRKYNINKISSLVRTAEAEDIIWKKIPKDSKFNNINEYRLTYIKTIISNQLLHNDCDLTWIQKANLISEIVQNKSLVLEEENLGELSIDTILTMLVRHKRFKLIIAIYAIYKKVFGEKW